MWSARPFLAPSVRPIASVTNAGSRNAANGTQNTPALNSGTSSAAASIASRVLPDPPGPERVSRRVPFPSRLTTSSRSRSLPTKDDYLQLLKLQYEVFTFVRKNGAVALDEHVNDMEKSGIFSKYPSFLQRHHSVEFFRDALKQIVNGTASAEELDSLLDAELDTHHEETSIPVALLQKTADSLPGLGIVAAVLGIIVTMGHLDGGPEEIGHHVAAALVGTFLGILLCYGLFHPIASNAELQEVANAKYLRCIKEGVVASQRGTSPIVAIEFARKSIFESARPSSDELDAAIKSLKATASA